MDIETIIKLSLKAGIEWHGVHAEPDGDKTLWKGDIETFAKLVAAAEREACAQVCDEQGKGRKALEHYAALTYSGAANDCAAAIRARGM